ncbi:hypothetical protein [Empedobacter brevis]|uniref:hypothetical protein n=1 Tax=Empedobacter brevis TaxID=247 RepID=UPI0028A860F7|nr:hypothetical protein [Empedobacter brevis]
MKIFFLALLLIFFITGFIYDESLLRKLLFFVPNEYEDFLGWMEILLKITLVATVLYFFMGYFTIKPQLFFTMPFVVIFVTFIFVKDFGFLSTLVFSVLSSFIGMFLSAFIMNRLMRLKRTN